MSGLGLARVAILCAAAAANAAAQNASGDQQNELERRSVGVLSAVQSRPLDELSHNIGFGYGVTGAYAFQVDRAGFLLLRADAAYVEYGRETMRVPLSPAIGGRIQVDVSTRNSIFPATLGAELTWPRGRVRPYVNAGVGALFFATTSSVDTYSDDDFSTTNQQDFTWSRVVGGGVYIPVSTDRNGDHLSIDVGFQRFMTGHASYLRPGSIQDLPTGTVITPLESDTHMVLVRIGVRYGR
jgi:Outer membrane protein beta-barrel domain